MFSLLLTISIVLLMISHAEAQTSLYIPGFEPQPVSADILGVGSDGRTTWALHQGKVTQAPDQSGFIGTATLVEGPLNASFTYANSAAHFTIGQACSFSEGFAICTIVAGGSTAVQTEFTSHVPVQVGSTVVGSPTITGPSSSDFSVPPTNPPSTTSSGGRSSFSVSPTPPPSTSSSGGSSSLSTSQAGQSLTQTNDTPRSASHLVKQSYSLRVLALGLGALILLFP